MDVAVSIINDIKGKGLISKKRFSNGSIIFEEDPLVCCQFSWNAAYQYKACDHCLRPLETAEENVRRLTGNVNLELPYSECCLTNKDSIVECDSCGLQYCSSECRKAAYDTYHKTLCLQTREKTLTHPLEQLNEAWKQIHYPPETNSVMLIARILALIHQSKNPEDIQSRILQFCHRTVNEDEQLAHTLLGEKFSNQISLLQNLMTEALPCENVAQFLTPEGFRSLLALIGTNGQGVGTSAVSQWVRRCSELSLSEVERSALDVFIDKLYQDMDAQSGNFLNNEGVALFSLQSVCNHSCVPNAEATYLHNNSRLSLVAIEDIEEGDEICISYLDECNLERSRHSRQKILMENYIFVCRCKKCEDEAQDPDETSDEEEEMSE